MIDDELETNLVEFWNNDLNVFVLYENKLR